MIAYVAFKTVFIFGTGVICYFIRLRNVRIRSSQKGAFVIERRKTKVSAWTLPKLFLTCLFFINSLSPLVLFILWEDKMVFIYFRKKKKTKDKEKKKTKDTEPVQDVDRIAHGKFLKQSVS